MTVGGGMMKQLQSIGAALGAGEAKLQTIEVSLIDLDPDQPRKSIDPEALEGLATSLKAQGFINHITVRSLAGRFVVETGERRFRAVRDILKWEKVTVVVKDTKPEQLRRRQLVENLQREGLSILDTADSIAAIVKSDGRGSSVKLADETGLDKALISKYVAISEGSEAFRAFVESGITRNIGTLYRLAKLSDDEFREESDVLRSSRALPTVAEPLPESNDAQNVSTSSRAASTTKPAARAAISKEAKKAVAERAEAVSQALQLPVKAAYSSAGVARIEVNCEYGRFLEIMDLLHNRS